MGVEIGVEFGVGAKVGVGIGVGVGAKVGDGLGAKVAAGVGVAAEVDAGAALGAVPPGRARPEPVGPCAPARPFTTGVGAFGRLNHRVRGDVSPELVGLGAAVRRPTDPRPPSAGTPRSADRRRAVGAGSEPVASRPAPAHRGRTTGRPAARRTGWGSPAAVLVVRGR